MYPDAVRVVFLFCLLSAALMAGTEPRAGAAAYSVRATAAHGELGADFTGRAVDVGKDSFLTGDYLVFEVALFAEKGPPIPISAGDFRLRLNSATREWTPVTAATVAASIRNPGYAEPPRGVVAGGGLGSGSIIVGKPRTAERFPGDPQARVPGRTRTDNLDPVESAAQAATRLALDSTKADAAGASGLIYFHWRGKMKDLKRVELIYEGAAGYAVLKLR